LVLLLAAGLFSRAAFAALPPPNAPDLQSAGDTGFSNADNVTRVTAPTFDVSGVAPGAAVFLFRDGSFLGFARAGDSGVVTFQDAGPLPDGAHSYFAFQNDGSGASDHSATTDILVDTQAPAAPAAPDLDAATDLGRSSTDNLTSSRHPSFTVRGLEGNVVLELLRDGKPVAVIAPASGAAVIQEPTALPSGTYTYTARQVDLAGNESPVSAGLKVTIQLRTVPSPSAPDLLPASDSGVSNMDNITNVVRPSFNVTTAPPPGETVQLLRALVGAKDYGVVGSRSGPGTVQDNGPVRPGVYLYAARQVDAAGNLSSLSSDLKVTLLGTPPPPVVSLDPAFDSGIVGDNLTNVRKPRLVISRLPQNASFTLLRNNVQIASGPTGGNGFTTVLETSPLPDGRYFYTARVTDLAGNTSAASTVFALQIDATASRAPSAPDLDPASDGGLSNTDNITPLDDLLFHVSGIESGASPELLRDGQVVASQPASRGASVYSLEDRGPVPLGAHVYTARQRDAAGNPGPASAGLTVTVDRHVPAAPAPPKLLTDSGVSNTDNITNINKPVFSVTGVEAGSRVFILRQSFSGTGPPTISPVGARTGPGNIAATEPIPDGSSGYFVVQTAPDGRYSSPSSATDVIIDTVAPSVFLSLSVESDTGLNNSDGITKDTHPKFRVAATEPLGRIQLLRDGKLVATVGNQPTSNATIQDPGPVPDGSHAYRVDVLDVAGNAASSDSLPVTIDTHGPPPLPAPDLPADADMGFSNTDNLTRVLSPRLDVMVTEAPGELQLLQDGVTVMRLLVRDSGLVPVGFFNPVSEGVHVFKVVLTDIAGNATTSAPLTVTFDATSPPPPPPPDLAELSDTGSSHSDNITRDLNPKFDLTIPEAPVMVELIMEGIPVVRTRVDQPGVVTVTVPNVSPGTHAFRLRISDAAGNTPGFTVPLEVTFDTTPPAPPPPLDLDAGSDTGISNSDDITADLRPILHFTTTEPGHFFINEDGENRIEGNQDQPGSYFIKLTDPVTPGTHVFTLVQEDAAGNDSPPSDPLTITFDTEAPPDATLRLDPASDTGRSSTDGITRDIHPFFQVTNPEPQAGVQLFRDGKLVAALTNQPTGAVLIQDPGPVPDGLHRYQVRLINLAGDIGALSTPLAVTLDTQAPEAPTRPDLKASSDTGASHKDNITTDRTPTFTGRAEADSRVTLLIDGAPKGAHRAVLERYTVTSSRLQAGRYEVTATATDAAGNVSPSSAALSVRVIAGSFRLLGSAAPAVALSYEGDLFVRTDAAASGRALVHLSAALHAPDGSAPALTGATVTFVDRDTGAVLATAPVTLPDPADPAHGAAKAAWAVDLGSRVCGVCRVGMVVRGSATRNTGLDDVLVTVARPLPGLLAAGGRVPNPHSAGALAGSEGEGTWFGVGGASGPAPEGMASVLIHSRQGGAMRAYLARSARLTALRADPDRGEASVEAGVQVWDVTDPLHPVARPGLAKLALSLKLLGSGPQAGITLRDDSLLYSSDWEEEGTQDRELSAGGVSLGGAR
jgi:hypothetical protein